MKIEEGVCQGCGNKPSTSDVESTSPQVLYCALELWISDADGLERAMIREFKIPAENKQQIIDEIEDTLKTWKVRE
jgi:hypothetical protein